MCMYCELGTGTGRPTPGDTFPAIPSHVRNSNGTDLTLGKQLGMGGFGRVLQARETLEPSKVFAVKLIDRKVIAKEAIGGLFLDQEVVIHKSMSTGAGHSHIVPFVSTFMTPTLLCMQIEYAPNGSLQDLLRARSRFTEPEMRRWTLQLIGALHHCHHRLVIHRDVKAANLILDANMDILLTDFGISASLKTKLDRRSTWVGSVDFTSPEIAEGSASGHSFEVDTWAVGVTLLFCLSGERPFYAADTEKIYERIKAGDFSVTTASHISAEAHALINSILIVDPKKRPDLLTIAEHPFFTTTPFPSQIPITAKFQIPHYPKEDHTKKQTLINFEAVMKRAKVPVKEVEVEIKPVGGVKRSPLKNNPKGKNVPRRNEKKPIKSNPNFERPKTRSQTKKEQENAKKTLPSLAALAQEGLRSKKLAPRLAALKREARVLR